MGEIRALVVDPDAPNRLGQVEKPSPTPSEALVSVAAVSLNRGEMRRTESSEPGFRPGWDLAGPIERAAADGPQEGSGVVGFLPSGAWTQLVAAPTVCFGGGRQRAREVRAGDGRLGRSLTVRGAGGLAVYLEYYPAYAVTLALSGLVLPKNELSGFLRRRPKPPRPTSPLVPCSIPVRLLPARKPAR